LLFYLNKNQLSPKDQKPIALQEIQKKYKNNRDVPAVSGSYEDFAPEKILLAKERRVILFFNASWCPSCNKLEDEVKQVSLPDNVLLLSIDYDKNPDLLRRYQVAYQHTFVEVDEFGNQLHKWSGGGIDRLKKELGIF
jgi:hypothetical protein